MPYVFIPGLSEQEKNLLTQNNLNHVNFSNEDEIGIIMNESLLDQALSILNIGIVSRVSTGFRELTKVILEDSHVFREEPAVSEPYIPEQPIFPEEPARQEETGDSGQSDSFNDIPERPPEFAVNIQDLPSVAMRMGFVELTKTILIPVVQNNVFVHYPGFSLTPFTDNTFSIHIWSALRGNADVTVPYTIFGIPRKSITPAFPYSGEGISIDDPETGFSVAELHGNNLYVHVSILDESDKTAREMYKILLNVVVLYITSRQDQISELISSNAKRLRDAARQSYVETSTGRLSINIEQTKRKIEEVHKEITDLQQKLLKAIRITLGAERKLSQLESCATEDLESYAKEFDKLITLPKVRDIHIEDGTISVYTDVLYCTNPKTGFIHEIGAFRIDINPTRKYSPVTWHNLTRTGYSGHQAPHVGYDGVPCLGNITNTITELVARLEFVATAMLAIQFVESVNVDDPWGRHIDSWPVASPVTKEDMGQDIEIREAA